ncbi:ATP-binding cassette domain-containing protein [candidate division WWE3 bacterium]|nr:ATP-binding cassette domain-containing protein [candidate division WWE3 bacterium]
MPQIEYRNIIKDYENDRILDDVSFKIDKGEFVFLIGPSGAGKSTLIKLLIRDELPTAGQIFFDSGVNTQQTKAETTSLVEEVSSIANISDIPHQMLPDLRRKIGVVFQDFKVLKSKNVFENVAIALEVADRSLSEIRKIVPNVLGLVGLSNKMDRFPKQLSGGELQRLSIARALAHEPDVLVADEPTGMIDPNSTIEVLNVLEKVNSLGTTVLMATHDYNIVNRLKKRVIRIENGKLISDKKEGTYDE